MTGQDERLVRSARLLTAVFGAGTLVALTLLVIGLGRAPRRPTWLEDAFGLLNVPVSRTLVSVVVLAIITRALVGRQRLGLVAVALCQVAGIVLGAVSLFALTAPTTPWSSRGTFGHVLNVAAMVIGVLILAWLWRIRAAFPVRPVNGSWAAAGTVLAIGAAASVALTWLALALVDEGGVRTLLLYLRAGIAGGFGDGDELTRRTGLLDTPLWIPQMTSLLLSATIVLAVVVFLRSARHEGDWSPRREIAIRRLLQRYGDRESLGYFATRRDKASTFAPDGSAVVTYRVISGVSMASGDPVGDPHGWDAAITEWLAQTRRNGWVPAAISVSESGARAFARAGMSAIAMGDEAILRPATFDLGSPDLAPVRVAARRAARHGLTVEIRRQERLDPAELAEIIERAEQWRGDEPDRGFSMALNRDGDPADGRMLFVTARDGEGVLLGLLGFVPWGSRGISLDLMRRSPDAPNGVTELLVSELMQRGPDLGIDAVSLNFIMFRGIYEGAARVGANPVTRWSNSVLGYLDRFWQLERLYRSNEKYQPEWYPRFLCLEDWVSLPQVGVAAGQAEGFVPTLSVLSSQPTRSLSEEELAEVEALATAPEVDVARLATSLPAQSRGRLEHLRALERSGQEGYPVGAGRPSTTIEQLAADPTPTGQVSVAGRVRRVRDHGGVVFVDLVDGSATAQLLIDRDTLGEEATEAFRRLVDHGDLIRVEGVMGASRRGEPSLLVATWEMLAKALHPLPFASFTDPATRLRQRATDLLVHPEQMALLRTRTRVLATVRSALARQGFVEVETPMLHTVPGGATARPFRTRSNAYGMDLSLRIAPELYLKRLLVAGSGPIFELGRNFRNEGADATHNPEFTSLEAYLPFADYTDMRHLTEALVKEAAAALHGRAMLPLRTGTDQERMLTDVSAPWPVVRVLDAVSAAVGQTVDLGTDLEVLRRLAAEHEVRIPDQAGPGRIIEEIYADLVEARTVMPTFYVDFPVETSPLTRPHREIPGLVERWDLVVDGTELGTAYSELTDPREQRRRLVEQSLRAAGGDVEAMEVDEDFLRDLETGMPPTGGLGIGMDRLVMLITGTTIRDVLTFPFVRPDRRTRQVAPEAEPPEGDAD